MGAFRLEAPLVVAYIARYGLPADRLAFSLSDPGVPVQRDESVLLVVAPTRPRSWSRALASWSRSRWPQPGPGCRHRHPTNRACGPGPPVRACPGTTHLCPPRGRRRTGLDHRRVHRRTALRRRGRRDRGAADGGGRRRGAWRHRARRRGSSWRPVRSGPDRIPGTDPTQQRKDKPMSPRFRRLLLRLSAATAVAASASAIAIPVLLHHVPTNHTFNVVAVEARAGVATQEADLAAELSQAESNGGMLLISAITDQIAAPDSMSSSSVRRRPIRSSRRTTCNSVKYSRQRWWPTGSLRGSGLLTSIFMRSSARWPGTSTRARPRRSASVDLFVNTLGDAVAPENSLTADLGGPRHRDHTRVGGRPAGAFPGPGGCRVLRGDMVRRPRPIRASSACTTCSPGCSRSAEASGQLGCPMDRARAWEMTLPPIPGVQVPVGNSRPPTGSRARSSRSGAWRSPGRCERLGNKGDIAVGVYPANPSTASGAPRHWRKQRRCAGVRPVDQPSQRARVCNQLVEDGVPVTLCIRKVSARRPVFPTCQRSVRVVVDGHA